MSRSTSCELRRVNLGIGERSNGYPSAMPAYQTFDRWERRAPDLERAIGQMFVLGISTRKRRNLCGELWGAPISSATVSRVTQALDYDVDAFLGRELDDDIEYLYFSRR